MLKVPVALILVPLSWNAEVTLTIPVKSVPVVPVSVNVKSVLGDPSASLIVKTPLLPAVASVIDGVLSDKVIGLVFEKILFSENVLVWF